MGATGTPDSDDVLAEAIGGGFAAGVRLLQSRYRLPADAAQLIGAAALATAIGPSATIRNPLGSDLPLSLELTFVAEPGSNAAAAVTGAFQVFQQSVHDKMRWKEAAGSRQLRARYVEILTCLETVEKELRRTEAPEPPPSPFPVTDANEVLKRTTAERQQLLEHRAHLRGELSDRRMDLLPYLVGNTGWDSLLQVDKLAFDGCFTNLSVDGACLRDLLAARPAELRRYARLLQASRSGGHMASGTSILINPVLINVAVVTRDLMARAVQHRDLREQGLLDGLTIDVSTGPADLDVAAFLDGDDEKLWHELIGTLFARRSRGVTTLHLLDREGFVAFEGFRAWCRQTMKATDAGSHRFITSWPAQVLKLALIVHLAAGGEENVVGASAVEVSVEALKGIGANQLELLETLHPVATDDVTVMVEKVRLLGGAATVRDVFRRYSGQNYGRLLPVLQQAVAEGRIQREGNQLQLLVPAAPT